MLQPDGDRIIVPAKQSLLKRAFRACLEGDKEFVDGLVPEIREPLAQISASLDRIRGLIQTNRYRELADKLPRIVDELVIDGWSPTAAEFVLVDYRSMPVSPRVFFQNTYYAGEFGEGLYPVNFNDMCWLLSPANRIMEVILTGSIRWGKTTIAVLMVAYRMYLLSLLRDPQSYFGLMAGSSIRYGIFNIFKYKTGEMYSRLTAIIDGSPYFQENFPRLNQERSKKLILPNYVSVIEGSVELHALGETLIGAILDEVNFMKQAKGRSRSSVETSLGQAQQLYSAVRGRLRNQFVSSPGTTAPYFMALLSQRRAQTDFLEKHIEEHGHEDGVAVISRAIWDVQPEGTYSGKTFRVFCGDSTAAARMLTDEDTDVTTNIVTVPEEHREDFEDNIEEAIRNVAGRATVASSALFSRPDIIHNAIDSTLVHPFELPFMVISTGDTVEISNAVREDIMFEIHMGSNRPRLHPNAARIMHIDLAATDASCGIACVHMTWQEARPVVVVDFAMRIDPPPRHMGQIDFDKIINFIRYLVKNGYRFQMISFDKWQSRHAVQIIHKMGILTDFVSVDETDEPYVNLRGLFESGCIRMYDYEPLTEELVRLEHDITLRKVFKPLNGSKDLADALSGAVWGIIPARKKPNKEKVLEAVSAGDAVPRFPITVGAGGKNA